MLFHFSHDDIIMNTYKIHFLLLVLPKLGETTATTDANNFDSVNSTTTKPENIVTVRLRFF